MNTDLTALPLGNGGAIFRREGKPITTSKIVADYFGKRHDNVLRDIDRLIKDDPQRALYFEETLEAVAMPKGGTRHVRVYTMNARGFALLAMGFTGSKAFALKERFLDAFDAMAERENDNHRAFLQSMKRTTTRRPRVAR
ncbi:hypothetical protein EBL89_15770 [Cereibacter sphaeroides]|uniref:Rha family transcriptional regulator n=1 Tax=Cereibacter sphaeroides TaxID=1063 RepID=UPI000F51D7FF|nr:Rha family transcriptional regulator [Cereibacter sphaeroides]AZB56683.1 hypothetical protein EBL89_15770 [Cereibacter sphaeroides]AZB60957.1 hypothetical protein EBL88_15740 [Cereibacter sphaeroides]